MTHVHVTDDVFRDANQKNVNFDLILKRRSSHSTISRVPTRNRIRTSHRFTRYVAERYFNTMIMNIPRKIHRGSFLRLNLMTPVIYSSTVIVRRGEKKGRKGAIAR